MDTLGTIQHTESNSEPSQSESPARSLSKTNEGYWRTRIRRRRYRTRDGAEAETADWHVQLCHGGTQRWVNLETANSATAARKARDAWLKLRASGWSAILQAKNEPLKNVTVGQFLDAVSLDGGLSPTAFAIYARKFRTLVAGVFGIRGTKDRFRAKSQGHADWQRRIDSVRLRRLNAHGVNRWRTRYLQRFSSTPDQRRKAARTIASIIRSSLALFSPKVIKRLHGITLPSPLPLADVERPTEKAAAYKSTINAALLFTIAQRELATPSDELLGTGLPELKKAQLRRQRTEMFKIFCLGLFAGLRRDEVDSLCWRQVDFERAVIRVETNEHTAAKSVASEREVDVDETFVALLKDWKAQSQSEFVIASRNAPRPAAFSYHHYRCATLFRKLNTWLRAKGVSARCALHTLRKEFGSQIQLEHGIYAASAALGHASIQLTKSVYVAKKQRTSFTLPVSIQSSEVSETVA